MNLHAKINVNVNGNSCPAMKAAAAANTISFYQSRLSIKFQLLSHRYIGLNAIQIMVFEFGGKFGKIGKLRHHTESMVLAGYTEYNS